MSSVALYRQLLRQEYRVFKGDHPVLKAAIAKSKSEFSKPTDDLPAAWKRGEEVISFLKRNLVQAIHTEQGPYRLQMTPDHEINDRIMPQKRGRCC